ncbi:DUF4132 domain-containing protein [Massilia frigida]|nr:DUF4132 domain-containing protein [Massilia frigida]
MRRFELSDGVSDKFWEVEQAGCDVNVCYGRIGTGGQRQSKTHADEAMAAAALAKLVREKTAKGYVATTSGACMQAPPAPMPTPVKPAPSVPAPLPSPPMPVAPAPSLVGMAAPWLAAGPALDIPPDIAALALPSRRFPGAPPQGDAERAWAVYLKHARQFCPAGVDMCDKDLRDGVAEATRRIEQGSRDGSLLSDAIMLSVSARFRLPCDGSDGFPFLDFLAAEKGLPHALEVLLTALENVVAEQLLDTSGAEPVACWRVRAPGDEIHRLTTTELALRRHLAHASQIDWDRCVHLARANVVRLPPRRRPLLAVILPDATDLADLILQNSANPMDTVSMWMNLMTASPLVSMALISIEATGSRLSDDDAHTALATLVQERGSGAIALLQRCTETDRLAEALIWFGTPEAIQALGRDLILAGDYFVRQRSINARLRLQRAVQRWPLASIAGLAELIAADQQVPHLFRAMLITLAYDHADNLAAFRPWISAPAAALLDSLAPDHASHALADSADLPPVLANPPWLAPRKKAAPALSLAALPLAPVERWSDDEREQMRMDERLTIYPYLDHTHSAPSQAGAAIAAGDVPALIAIWEQAARNREYFSACVRIIADMPAPFSLAVWNACAQHPINSPGYAVATFGLRGLPALVAMCEHHPAEALRYTRHIGAVELGLPIARAYMTLKTKAIRASAREWLLAYPEHAACALLAPALGKAGSAREHAADTLRMLAAAGHDVLLMEVAARYGQLAAGTALRALLDQHPLDLYPAKWGAAPQFWRPRDWPRPRLASNGKALPDAAIEAFGDMLRFPRNERVYAGLAQVQRACTPDSLTTFAWNLFRAWEDDGGSAKDNWAFSTLGILGDDAIADKIGPMVRAWPAEALHARAAGGVEVLGAIGTDAALLQLSAIVRHFHSGSLKEAARAKMAQIAEARDMPPEELEDHLAPDLGLDQQGVLRLAFGTRHFVVGFDEALRPVVRDQYGTQLSDLPKPRQSDDEALSRAAVERYKQLRKDARSIASLQVNRLDAAMRTRRRWSVDNFMKLIAGHRLVRHLAQRLVWGMYRDQRLQACFRLGADGALTDGADDAFLLAQEDGIVVGIPHPLDMQGGDLAAFDQLFTDYELTQPFTQIHRATYALDPAELASDRLLRWDGMVVASGSIMGLANRGWRRGRTLERSFVREFSKPLGDGRLAQLQFEPGIVIAAMDQYPEQTVQLVLFGDSDRHGNVDPGVPLAQLDPVAASELIRDIELLRA